MSKKISRTIILGLCVVMAALSHYFGIYALSYYFSGIFGFMLGIIAMKERDKLKFFALSHGVDVDKECSDESNKEEATG